MDRSTSGVVRSMLKIMWECLKFGKAAARVTVDVEFDSDETCISLLRKG